MDEIFSKDLTLEQTVKVIDSLRNIEGLEFNGYGGQICLNETEKRELDKKAYITIRKYFEKKLGAKKGCLNISRIMPSGGLYCLGFSGNIDADEVVKLGLYRGFFECNELNNENDFKLVRPILAVLNKINSRTYKLEITSVVDELDYSGKRAEEIEQEYLSKVFGILDNLSLL